MPNVVNGERSQEPLGVRLIQLAELGTIDRRMLVYHAVPDDDQLHVTPFAARLDPRDFVAAELLAMSVKVALYDGDCRRVRMHMV